MCRKLNADEIECRVAQVSAKGCSLLLYKTARVDRAILDETYGKMSWQNDFKVVDGKMYGGIGIYSNDLDEWIWKWDCGTESNTEAEKGQASDCFKRAAFKWGIGVELYSAPFIWLNVKTIKNEKGKWELEDKYVKYHVKNINYLHDEISVLSIADDKGNVVYELGKKQKTTNKEEPTNKEENLIDEDYDIISQIPDKNTILLLQKYYNEQKGNVKDIKRFNAEITKQKRKLEAK